MQKRALCDTGILIKYLRNDTTLTGQLDTLGFSGLYISIITVAEILNGTSKRERKRTLELLNRFNILHFDKSISKKFKTLSFFMLSKENNIAIPDIIIAATALEYGIDLYTLNKKDFASIPGIKLYRP